MPNRPTILLAIATLLMSAQVMSQVTFYEGANFRGRAFTTSRENPDFRRGGFNNRASSVIVDGGRWEVCEGANFRGRCVVLRQGSYDSLERMGVNNDLSSARRARSGTHYDFESGEPLAAPDYEYRRRSHERVYEARVTSARAVLGDPEQRCWIEREQYDRGRDNHSVVGGVVGGVIGGILGHQVGRGAGRDVATVGGAIAGAAIGSNVGRGGSDYGREVRQCEDIRDSAPDYWDVRYTFRNVDHRIQMTDPPGRIIYVNRQGEPRQ
jgi:uncharacterized protein YcfJ